jgi:hypothetical protein
MVEAEEGNSWIYKNKDHGKHFHVSHYESPLTHDSGMMSAAASLGLSLLWDTDVGLNTVDKYSYSPEEYIKVRLFLDPVFEVTHPVPVTGRCAHGDGHSQQRCADRSRHRARSARGPP